MAGFPPRLGIFIGLFTLGIAMMTGRTRHTGTSSVAPLSLGVAIAQDHNKASDAEALALWKRTLRAQINQPLRARAVITRWSERGRAEPSQVVDVVEGTGGRYRFTYLAPPPVRGRVVINDGKYVYQYEPERQVVLRRPAPPGSETMTGASIPSLSPRVLPERTIVAGLSVRVLEIHGARTGGLRERRWVEEKTGRSLRIEEYAKDGKPSRRVELAQVSFAPSTDPKTFQPAFPRSARIMNAAAHRDPVPGGVARRLGLPDTVVGYRLRSVVLTRPAASPRTATAVRDPQRHHLLYSNGIHTVSVFVTEETTATNKLRPAPGWKSTTLLPGIVGYATDEDSAGRAAVAWARSGRRYVVVGRLPLERIVEVTRDLARGVDKINKD